MHRCEANIWFHGDGDGFKVLKSILGDDGVKVQALAEENEMVFTFMADFNPKEPVELTDEEHGICYGVKRGNASRSGTTQKPTNTNTKSTPIQKHILIV